MEAQARVEIGRVPFIFVVNKHDRIAEWEVVDSQLDRRRAPAWDILRSGAKTGEGVEEAFAQLTAKIWG